MVYEGDGRSSESCNSVVPLPWVLGLVRCGMPVEVEEEIKLKGNLSSWQQKGAIG